MSPTVFNRLLLVLSYAGVFVAGVLSVAAGQDMDVPCGPSSGCHRVAADPSSHLFGIPNAYIGLAGYLILAAFATYRELCGIGGPKGRITVYAGYACAAGGTLASMYLTYISIENIHAECFWCLSSAVIMTLTLFVYMLLAVKVDGASPHPMPGNSGAILVAALAICSVVGIAGTMKGMTKSAEHKFQMPEAERLQLTGPDAHILNPNGVVTVVEFGDLDCPTCRHLYPQMEQAVSTSNGKIRFVFHHFPLWMNPDHKGALPGAIISEIAAEKGEFWKYLDLAYADRPHNSPDPSPDEMINFGTQLGLSDSDIRKRLGDELDPARVRVQNDLDRAAKFNVMNTPTFIVLAGKMDAVQVSGRAVFDVLAEPEYKALLSSKTP